MAIKVTIDYDRLNETRDAIEKDVRQGIIDMATGIQGAAQSVAPVQSGFMRDHIFVRPEGYPDVVIESEAEYSGFVEYGTRDNPAQPFMRPAYEQSRVSSLERLRARLAAKYGRVTLSH